MRTEPPPSLPTASGPMPAATARAGARAGAAGRALQVPRIARRLEDGVVARAAVAELGHVGLAQDHRAGIPQALDHHVVLLGHEILVGDGAGDGGEVLGADKVLDADRHARERGRGLRPPRSWRPPGERRRGHSPGAGVQKACTWGSTCSMWAVTASATSIAESSLARTRAASVTASIRQISLAFVVM